ncbi:hypothetical protein [Mucilaginibacter ginkgonis]|uniref:Uncharacterized protein n=1 Tax=Mucilaginibacter ginkgonis TaxID=2682091 RepID=A0A6I4I017_9SPHI|nr:hypothetical protein [Mucilaginibacter ginkgonis]QQL48932.1 hypothetical protein GO620_012175 [Mucilaginibacter ginkgonis]
MTTIIIDIDKQEDLAEVKEFLAAKGLFYEENENSYEDFVYTDQMKKELDEDEEALQRGEIVPISAEESERRISEILNKVKV